MTSRRLSLAAILSACAAYGVGMGLTLPLLGIVLERRGYPGTVNGLSLAVAGAAALIITPFMPRWIARFGAAQYLAVSLIVAALALLALYGVHNLWLWFAARFVLSSALNGLFVVSEFWINQLADERNRGRYIALYSIAVAGSFGIGPALLLLIGTQGIGPFAAGAAMLLAGLIPVLLARNAAPHLDEAHDSTVFSVLGAAPVAFAAAFVFGAIDAGMLGLLPVYALRLGYGEAPAALVVTAMSLGSIVLQYPLGILTDRMNRKALLALCAATGVIGSALIPFTMHTPLLLYALLFVWGGLILGVYSVGLTLIGERFKGAELANANAAFVIAYCAGMLLGPVAEGLGLDLWNPHGLLVVLGAICGIYAAIVMPWRRRIVGR